MSRKPQIRCPPSRWSLHSKANTGSFVCTLTCTSPTTFRCTLLCTLTCTLPTTYVYIGLCTCCCAPGCSSSKVWTKLKTLWHIVQLALHPVALSHHPLYLHIAHISPNRHNTDKYKVCTYPLATIGLHHEMHLPLGLPSLRMYISKWVGEPDYGMACSLSHTSLLSEWGCLGIGRPQGQ